MSREGINLERNLVVATGITSFLHIFSVTFQQSFHCSLHKCRFLAEGDAQARKDIVYLNKLPVFNADGTVKE